MRDVVVWLKKFKVIVEVLLDRTLQVFALFDDPCMLQEGEVIVVWLAGITTFIMPTDVGNLGVYIIFTAPTPLIAVLVLVKAQDKPVDAALGTKLVGITEEIATV